MGKSLVKSTSLVSGMTLFSRILGFLRDVILAQYFGTTAAFDAFLVAFRIPNFMRRLFAEGAFSQAFVPVLSEYRQKRSHEEVQRFIDHMMGTLAGVLLLVSLLAVIAAPLVVLLFAPGFLHDATRLGLASSMLRVTFPYILLISVTAFGSAVLNTYDRFGIPAFTPALLNVAMMGAAVWLSPYFQQPVQALAWGVLLGGVLQLSFQLPFLTRLKLFPWPRWGWRDSGVKKVLGLMVPAIFGVSVAQVSLLVDTLFASFLPIGSISWLYFSERLMNFPLGIFGVALATVVLPQLSKNHVDNNNKDYSSIMDWGIRSVLLLGVPAAIGLAVLSGPLLVTLFQYKRFLGVDVLMAQKSLIAFSVGIPAFMMVKVLAAGFYSRQDIKTPVRIAVIAMCTNMALNAVFIVPLRHAGLALATALAAIVNASLLFRSLRRIAGFQLAPGWFLFLLRITVSNAAMALVASALSADLSLWLSWGWRQRVLHLSVIVVSAIVTYFAVLWMSGMRWKEMKVTYL